MSTYLYEMRVNWDGSVGVVDFDAPEGMIATANVVVTGLADGNLTPYTPMYQIIDTVIRVTIANNSTSADGSNTLVFTITQNKGFQDSTGTFVAGTQTSIDPNSAPTLSIDQSVVGQVKFNFGIPRGQNGANGKSAFEIAQDQGWTGSDFAWLQSLKGVNGKSAYEVAVANGFSGNETQWLASLKGVKGDKGNEGSSAYSVAVGNGFQGSIAQWLESLKGAKGDTGSSAYQSAVANGFVGTEAEWIASLKGNKGDKGDAATGGSRYDELAGGVFWWVRPRYNVTPNAIYNNDVSPTVYLDEYALKTDFVVEDTLYTDHGVYVPNTGKLIPTRQKGWSIRVVPTSVQPFGTASVGRFTDRWTPMSSIVSTLNFQGCYYVELDSSVVVANGINESNLNLIEVEVSGTQADGYEVLYDPTTRIIMNSGKAKGVIFPTYLGAMYDPENGKVYLIFRPYTYAKRRNTATVEDTMEWDGIGTNGGESGGWALTDPDVRWWSTNVAQGFRFVAKIRKR